MSDAMPEAHTDPKRVERDLLRAREIAEDTSRAKDARIASLSHDLRTPLTLILSPLDALLAPGRCSPEVARALTRVRRNAGRLSQLVDAMLDLGKLGAPEVEPSWSALSVSDVCAQVVADAQPTANARGITLSLATDGEVEIAPLDRCLFEKIVVTLVKNAIELTPAGRRVEVALSADEDGFVLSVSGGVAEGSALGLSLVKELGERLGGAVSAESRPGEGSRVSVRLPRDPDRAAALLRAQREARLEAAVLRTMAQLDDVPVPSSPPPPLSGLKPRLILAESDLDLREHVTELLEGEYDVIAVEDGRAALSAARACPPDLLVTDVVLPELDGMALLGALKEDDALRAVPVVLLTARVEALSAGLERGADDFIAKPFSPVELCARLRAARRLHKLRQQLQLTVAELSETRADLSVASRRAPASARAEVAAQIGEPLGALASALRARPGQEDLADAADAVLTRLRG